MTGKILHFPSRLDRKAIERQIEQLQAQLRRTSGRPRKADDCYLGFFLAWEHDRLVRPHLQNSRRRAEFVRRRVAEKHGLRLGKGNGPFTKALARGRWRFAQTVERIMLRRSRTSLLDSTPPKQLDFASYVRLVPVQPKYLKTTNSIKAT